MTDIAYRRHVSVKGRTCKHVFSVRSHLPVEEISGDRKYICHECARRVKVNVLFEGNRRCAVCKVTWLAASHEDDECFACIEARRIKGMKTGDELWQEHLTTEKRAVLLALPGELPAVITRSGVRWVDAQRVLREGIAAGDVIVWNIPGRRPIYKLIGEVPPEPETPEGPAMGERVMGILDLLPATATEVAVALDYKKPANARDVLRRMEIRGLVHRTGTGVNFDPWVWQPGPGVGP